MAKPLHPKLQQRAAAVKAAHAHLTQTVPGFRAMPGRQQIVRAHRHATRMLKQQGGL